MDLSPPLAPIAPAYKDRHAWLIVFGIFEIGLGAFCALFIPLTLFSQAAGAQRAGQEFDLAFALPAVVLFAVLALGLVWLGIGSTLARRWARALLLCFGWMGLCIGIVGLAVMIPVLGALDELIGQQSATLPPGTLTVVKFVAFVTVAVVYVLIPGLIVLFYRGANVRRTCEVRDPRQRWTDRCPLPVLAMCILQAFGALSILLIPHFGAVMPVAGFLVTGWAARIAWLGFGVFSLYAARGFYRLERRVWLIYLIVIFLSWLSYCFTFLHVGLLDYYRAVGLPQGQIDLLANSPLIQNRTLLWICSFSVLPLFGYLFYLRRFFPAPPTEQPLIAS